jgi:hypothetical protein
MKLVAGIASICEDMAQPGEAFAHGLEDIDGTVVVLDVGGVGEDENNNAAGVRQDVALAAFDLLSRIIAARPPLSVVFTEWLPITPALGEASRPSPAGSRPTPCSWPRADRCCVKCGSSAGPPRPGGSTWAEASRRSRLPQCTAGHSPLRACPLCDVDLRAWLAG